MKIISKILLVVLACLLQLNTTFAQHGGGDANPGLYTNQKALEKFQNNRFGMFIHWGPVTLRGEEISWSRGNQIPKEEYDNLYKEFNPVLFNAKDWVSAAKNAGMKYMVLTTRHHDGFSLWDSQYTDYDMANTPYGKGVVKALADECKKQGIDFCVYYSVCDWWNEDYPVSYPQEGYESPQKGINDPGIRAGMDRYIQYMKNQLKELIDNYDPTMIWFDGEWEWAWTHEMGTDLYAYLRGLKDEMLINNRVDKGRRGMEGVTQSKIFAGDFATPEQQIGKFDHENPWESCMTIATQWAWKANDKLKSKKECIHTLLQTVGGDGNLLFNVGPMADGRIEQRQVDRLKEMGDWLAVNGEAVYGTRGGPYMPTDRFVSTRKDNKIYLHLLENAEGSLDLTIPKGIRIKKAYFLDGGSPVTVKQSKSALKIEVPDELSDAIASVLVLELNKAATDIEVIK